MYLKLPTENLKLIIYNGDWSRPTRAQKSEYIRILNVLGPVADTEKNQGGAEGADRHRDCVNKNFCMEISFKFNSRDIGFTSLYCGQGEGARPHMYPPLTWSWT